MMIYNNVFFPSGMLFKNELYRLKFKYSGMVADYTESQKKMILIHWIIYRILLENIISKPYLKLQNYLINQTKRLNIRIVCSIIYISYNSYIEKFCPYNIKSLKPIKE